MRKTLREIQENVFRRLEQLRFEAKGEARVRLVSPGGALVPRVPFQDRRPLALGGVTLAMLLTSFALFAGVEAISLTRFPAVKPEAVGEV